MIMKFKTLGDLESHNKEAHDSLIDLWMVLSRTSSKTARRDIEEGIGFRYELESNNGVITFTDTESADTFTYTKENNWSQ